MRMKGSLREKRPKLKKHHPTLILQNNKLRLHYAQPMNKYSGGPKFQYSLPRVIFSKHRHRGLPFNSISFHIKESKHCLATIRILLAWNSDFAMKLNFHFNFDDYIHSCINLKFFKINLPLFNGLHTRLLCDYIF